MPPTDPGPGTVRGRGGVQRLDSSQTYRLVQPDGFGKASHADCMRQSGSHDFAAIGQLGYHPLLLVTIRVMLLALAIGYFAMLRSSWGSWSSILANWPGRPIRSGQPRRPGQAGLARPARTLKTNETQQI